MPFLTGDDADDYYYGYDAAYRRRAKKDKTIFSCFPCFIPCSPGAEDPTAHRRLLSSDSSDNLAAADTDTDTADIAADLARLRVRYSSRPPGRPREVPGLIARTDEPPVAVAALSWLGGDYRPSCILLTFLPALFPAHARHALAAAARHLHPREAALDGEVAEYKCTYAVKLSSAKTKDGIAETAAAELCKMARAARRADKLRWRAMEAAVKEVLSPAQAREFLRAVHDVAGKVRRHGARWQARAGPLTVAGEVFERMRANARAATNDAW